MFFLSILFHFRTLFILMLYDAGWSLVRYAFLSLQTYAPYRSFTRVTFTSCFFLLLLLLLSSSSLLSFSLAIYFTSLFIHRPYISSTCPKYLISVTNHMYNSLMLCILLLLLILPLLSSLKTPRGNVAPVAYLHC